jgi:WD40 repeat protein
VIATTEVPVLVEPIGNITSQEVQVWLNRGSDSFDVDKDTTRDLQNQDGVKVENGGKGELEFPGPVILLVYNSSELEALTAAEVDPGASNKLIAGKLIRGGMLGYVEPGSELTIRLPGGVEVKVLGTNFFIVHDEENGLNYVGNFDGTVIVSTPASGKSYLPANEMGTIDTGGNVAFSPVSFSSQEFDRSASENELPIDALEQLQDQSKIPLPVEAPPYADWKQHMILADHTDDVNQAVFSPDGRTLVTTSYDGSAILYDTGDWEKIILLHPEGSTVWSAAFSPDSQYLATGCSDTVVRVWRVSDGSLIGSIKTQGDVWYVSFSPNGDYVAAAAGDPDNTIKLWWWVQTIDAVEPMVLSGHKGNVWVAAFSPTGQYILSASSDGTANVYTIDYAYYTYTTTTLSGHTDWIPWAEFSPDGQYVLTASADRTVRIWTLDGNLISVLEGHGDTVWRASFSPDRNSVVTASGDGLVRIFDPWSGKLQREIPGFSGGAIGAVYSPNGEFIGAASVDGTGLVYEIGTDHSVQLTGHSGRLYTITFSPDSKMVVTTGADGRVIVWVRVH